MDFPYCVFGHATGLLRGVAEIAGTGPDRWQIANIYVQDAGVLRHAGRDEYQQITWVLQVGYGGDIGRAWRASLEGQHEETD
jgi:hypothetical protein